MRALLAQLGGAAIVARSPRWNFGHGTQSDPIRTVLHRLVLAVGAGMGRAFLFTILLRARACSMRASSEMH